MGRNKINPYGVDPPEVAAETFPAHAGLLLMAKPADQRTVSQDELTRQMSEVISLREKVAQAELAMHLYGITSPVGGEKAKAATRAD